VFVTPTKVRGVSPKKDFYFQKRTISRLGHYRRDDVSAAPVVPLQVLITARCRQKQARHSHWTQPCIDSAIHNRAAVRMQFECSSYAVEVQSVCSRSAAKGQADCSRFAVHMKSLLGPRTLFHSCSLSPSSSENSLISLPLVCAAGQVSVTVRLPCFGMKALRGTSGHHARFVSLWCCLPARHGIGGNGAILLEVLAIAEA
jgi:hypothetical protein